MPASAMKDWLVGEIILSGFEAVKFTLEELFPLTGSSTPEETEAVLPTMAPLATEQLSVAAMVMVAEAPEASVAKVTVRLLPEPPQTPPPVELQLTKVTVAGRLSVTTTDEAGSGPLLVTEIV